MARRTRRRLVVVELRTVSVDENVVADEQRVRTAVVEQGTHRTLGNRHVRVDDQRLLTDDHRTIGNLDRELRIVKGLHHQINRQTTMPID